jgi:hypothetical protein
VVGAYFFLGTSGDGDDVATATSTTTTVDRDTGRSTTSSTSSTTTTVESVDGMTPYEDVTHGFSISTPSSWRQVDPTDPAAQGAIDEMLRQNPQLAGAMGSASALTESGIVFMATDIAGGSTVNVIVQDAPGAPSSPTDADLELIAPEFVAGLQLTGAVVDPHRIVDVNGRKALRVDYSLPLTNGGTEVTVHGSAYVIVTFNTVYVVTIIGDGTTVERVISTFEVG